MIRNAATSAILLASFLTTPLLAEEPARVQSAWPRTITVSATIEYGDLDLATPEGVAEAHRRASQIIGQMCRPDPAPAVQSRGRIDGHCFRQAMATARVRIEQVVAARNGHIRTALNGSARGVAED